MQHYFSPVILILVACSICAAQSSTGQVDNPTTKNIERSFRPKLLLQDALKIADDYIRDQHIDVSHYWLYQAKFIVYGEKGKGQPAWHIWWMSDPPSLGDYVTIVVFMDGKAIRTPSM